MDNNRIKLLDCTLRDGGQGLEAANRIGFSDKKFTKDIIKNVTDHLVNSDIDIVELGYIEKSIYEGHPFANHFSVEEVSKFIPIEKNTKQMYVALFTGPDFEENMIPEWNPRLVDGTRVIIRYSELEKSIDYCEMLVKKGYKVFIQPMLTMRYSDEEMDYLIERANDMHAYALYFVDSYGYMQTEDIEHFFNLYNKKLDSDICIGFHAHNNLNLAFSNVQHFLKISEDRKVIVDSTAIGMGQGAGNLQTEIILPFLNKIYSKKYDFEELLEVCELIEPLTSVGQWGYSVGMAIPAIHKAAYKYAMVMRFNLGFSYRKINYVIKNIPEELKHRYTDENLKILLKELNL